MRIAYISNEYPPLVYGGLGVYVDSISRHIASLGHGIAVFTWGEDGLEEQEAVDGVDVSRVQPLPMRDCLEIFLSQETLGWGAGLRFLLDLLSYNQISAERIISDGPFDLCVSQDWLGLPGGMAVRRAGVPLIYHVHGLETGRSERPNPQLVALERRGTEVADKVITVSYAMRQELVALGASPDKIAVCYHGVDSGFFDPGRADPVRLSALRERYGLGDEDTVLLFLGRLEPVKGVLQLLSALPAVRRQHPEVKLLLVGKGSLEVPARREAERQGGIILVTDFLDSEDKMLHYALADLCVFPSLYEPFGIVALEAASMGRPAVVGASGTSGLREIVQNPSSESPTGVHVNARDPGDIAWGINLALADPVMMSEWGRNARKRALSEFTWQRAVDRTLGIYQEVASRQS
ncbi:MAG: glycosyltransferase family 4 protein [Methanothrix sp.]|nr:glycosyltransferase family 4 protein [Methanothrix sp.]